MTTLTITHTHETGTLIDGTERGDGTAEVLKAHGWRWSGKLGQWYVPQTRLVKSPARAQMVVRISVAALQEAGFTVEVEADWALSDDAPGLKLDRQRERVAALEAKVARRHAESETADARDMAATNALPPGGEPIKVGHHSEGRHRRALERAHATVRAAIAAHDAERDAEAALNAARTTLASMTASTPVTLTRDDVAGATAVRTRHGWYRVVRVNDKSVTVETDYSWTDRIPVEKILEVRK